MIRRRAVTLIALSWLGSLGLAYGNWTASGTFRYTDREFDQTGHRRGTSASYPVC